MPRDIINGAAFPREQVVSEVPGDTLFVPVYTDDTGQAIGIPAAGDCLFGSPTTRYALLPRAARMLNLGSEDLPFEDGNFAGELSGNRTNVPFGRKLTFNSTTFFNMVDGVPTSVLVGYPILRAGGLVGVSACFEVQVVTTEGVVAIRAFKNGTAALSVISATITSADAGNMIIVSDVIARSSLSALQKTAVGDVIAVDCQFVTFAGTLKLSAAIVEIVTNT